MIFILAFSFTAPSAPRNVSVHVLDAHQIRVSWESPALIHGPISMAEADMNLMVSGKWLSRKDRFRDNSEQRYRTIGSSNPLKANTNYKIRIREGIGSDSQWGPYSDTVLFSTPEGSRFRNIHSIQSSVCLSRIDISSMLLFPLNHFRNC